MTDTPEADITEVDLDALLAQATEALDGDDGGPSPEGELLEDDADAAGDESDSDDSDDLAGDDLEDADEAGTEDESSDADEGEDEGEEPDTRASELEEERARRLDLEQRYKALELQSQQLLALIQGGASPSQPQQQQPAVSPEVVSALQALHLGDEEGFKGYPQQARAEAARLAREHAVSQARYQVDPTARYMELVHPFVERYVAHALQPFVQQSEQARFQQAIEVHKGVLQSDGDFSRLSQILDTIPGKGGPWADQQKRLDIAVKQLASEKQTGAVAKREQKLSTKEKQLQARKAKRRSTSGRRGGSTKPKAPTVSNVDDLLGDDFLKFYAQQGNE